MPESFDPVTLQNDTGVKLNAAYFNRLETNLETIDDRAAALERGITAPVTLTASGGAITPDAAAGALFRHTATANVTLNEPINGANGQSMTIEVTASGGARTLSFAGGTVPSVVISMGETWIGTLICDLGAGAWRLQDGGGSGSTVAVRSSLDAATQGDAVQRIGVATYFYTTTVGAQGNYWDRTLKYAPVVDIVIVNPASGPGVSTDSTYTAMIAKAQASGATVLGYVTSSYATKSAASIVVEIDTWRTLYPAIDGIFIDEASNSTANLAHYQTLYNHVKSVFSSAKRRLVVMNPGVATDEAFMAYADIIMTFEGDPTMYRARVDPAWERNYPASRFWHIVHSIASLTELDEMIALTRTKRAGYVQFHDGTMPFPYGVLPNDPFWSHQVAAISRGLAQFPVDLAGAVTIGGDNGMSPLRLRGRKTTTGAPLTGTWVAGDLVIDSAGAWHLCTAGGTPGTWT